eukprot:m.421298 g.421298  ORF g.421298 m.421298 type:complete len:356 (+) comp33753_c0_seq1:70-1137(+)
MGQVLSYFEPAPNPDRVTGEQRREGRLQTKFLPSKPQSILLPPDHEIDGLLEIETGLIELPGRGQCYWMTVVPKDFERVTKVAVFFHGYSDHVGDNFQNMMLAYAHLHGVACIGFDMEGHGRSDGLHVMVESWHRFVAWATDFLDAFVPDKVKEWSHRLGGRNLKTFAVGESMGGAVLAHVCLLSPSRFDGVVLVCPMLDVHAKVRPGWITETLLQRLIVPLIPTWQITPGEPVRHLLLHDVEAAEKAHSANTYGARDAKPRLQTAFELGVVGCAWLQEHLSEFSTSFLIYHGGDDMVTSPDVSRRMHTVAASEDKELQIVDGAWHAELFSGFDNEAQQRIAYQRVADWMETRAQ